MHTTAYKDFVDHARSEAPREACGFLVQAAGDDEIYVSSRNTAPDPTQHFVTHKEDYLAAAARGKIIAVCHSHPDAPCTPSPSDRDACTASALPWYILSLPSGAMTRLEPGTARAPLVGRSFVHGVHDCYAIIRDYYAGVPLEQQSHAGSGLSIELPDFPRDYEWWNQQGQNLYLDNFGDAGFVVVGDGPQRHDVILMQVRGTGVPNHAAVYLGDGRMLHHLAGKERLSERVIYGGTWATLTTHVLRHRMLMA